MDYDGLVNLIVEEVLKRMEGTNRIQSNKPVAVIFDKDDLQEYSNIYGAEYDVKLYSDEIKKCDLVIISKLCLKGIANLANLISASKEESFIIKMLMKGTRIYIVEEGLFYKKYKNTAPRQVYSKYLEFEQTLRNYGIEFISNSINVQESKNKNTINEEKSIRINKKLISETDVRREHQSGSKVIFIDSKSIITPLARDYIKMNHIEIIKKEG